MAVARDVLGHWTCRKAFVAARHRDSHGFTLGNIMHRLYMVFTSDFNQHPVNRWTGAAKFRPT